MYICDWICEKDLVHVLTFKLYMAGLLYYLQHT